MWLDNDINRRISTTIGPGFSNPRITSGGTGYICGSWTRDRILGKGPLAPPPPPSP